MPTATSAAGGSRTTCARSTATRTASWSPPSSARACASSAARCRSGRRSRAVELPHPWTDAELAAIEEDVLAEKPRGRQPALLGRRQGRRRDRHHHQGAAGADGLHRLHRRRGGADSAHLGARGGAAALSQAPEVGVSRPDDACAGAGVLGALQRLRGEAAGRAGGLRRGHPAHLLGHPRADQLDGRRRASSSRSPANTARTCTCRT